jgi:GDP-L-fucose synthase
MIIVTGASGFLGRTVAAHIPEARGLSSSDLDLTDGAAVAEAFDEWKPAVVIHLAARVGGITENISRSADFLIDNLRIDANILNALRLNRPEHFIPMLSTCMYPDRLADDRYPMVEDDIEDGAPPPTNAAYAAAKRSLMHGTRALYDQYGVPYSAFIPANLYGPGDHFGERRSHFLAAAIDKIEAARLASQSSVEFFGTGQALRQYVLASDIAKLVAASVQRGPINCALNVAPTRNRSIKSLAETVAGVAGFDGVIEFNGEGPDGQLRKDVSSGKLTTRFPEWHEIETPLEIGIEQTIGWYREHVATR